MSIAHNTVKPGVYRHFKGNIYHVLGIAENTETGELTVVYIPQYGEHKAGWPIAIWQCLSRRWTVPSTITKVHVSN